MNALTRRTPLALPDGPRATYTPGPLRRASDSEHEMVAAFVERHPQYARLSHLELVTLAATYIGEDRRLEIDALEDAGVPADWHRSDDFAEEAP